MTPEEGESAVPTKDVAVPEILAFGPGHVVLDPLTGAPLRFVDEEHSQRQFLLDTDATAWHSVEHQWGADTWSRTGARPAGTHPPNCGRRTG